MLQVLTERMVPWNEVVQLPTLGAAADRIADLRGEYLSMTATGLVIIGRTVYQINKLPGVTEIERLDMYGQLATEINWRRDADIWQGSVVNGGKLVTNRGPIALAVERVWNELGFTGVSK